MINWTTLKSSMYDILFAASGSVAIIWSNQDGLQPTTPYLTLDFDSLVSVGIDYYGRPAATGSNTITGNREFTLQIQAFGAGSFTTLEKIKMNLRKITYQDNLRTAGFVVVDILPVNNITELEDTKFQERASMDIIFRVDQIDTDAPGFIGIVKDMEMEIKENETVIIDELINVDSIS